MSSIIFIAEFLATYRLSVWQSNYYLDNYVDSDKLFDGCNLYFEIQEVWRCGMKKKQTLKDRLLDEVYDNLTDFVRRSGCPVSPETIRLAVYEARPVSIPSLILILKHLGFGPVEIRERLEEMGERNFSELLPSSAKDTSALAPWEQRLLQVARKARETKPELWNSLINHIGLMLGEDLTKLEMKGNKKG